MQKLQYSPKELSGIVYLAHSLVLQFFMRFAMSGNQNSVKAVTCPLIAPVSLTQEL